MASSVHAKGVSSSIALHSVLEVLEVNAFEDELGDISESVVALGEEGVEVTFQTTRVVFIVAVDVLGVGQVQRAEIDSDVGEGAAFDTTATSAGRHVDTLSVEVGIAAVGDVLAIGTHTVLVTGKEG